MRTFAAGFFALLAPRACAACDSPLQLATELFCGGCAPLIEPLAGPLAPPSPHGAAYVYAGPLADAICRLKYGRRTELGAGLGKLLAARALAHAGWVDRVVPLPLHPRKLRARGFNPAALLGREVADALGVPLCVASLRRTRDTPEQAGLSRTQRASNVRGAFRAQTAPARTTRVLLVDDVRTTGATLAQAASVLLESGHEVRTLALAFADADADADT